MASKVIEFVPKDASPIQQLVDGSLVSDNGEIKASFVKDASGANSVLFESNGYSVKWYPKEIKYVDLDSGMEDILYDADYANDAFASRDFNVRYNRHFPDVDEWFRVDAGQIKHNVTLLDQPRQPADYIANPTFVVSGTIEFPQSFQVRSEEQVGGCFITDGTINFIDEKGYTCFRMPEIDVWDQVGNRTKGKYIVNSYNDGVLDFSMAVDYAFISNSSIVYPVIVDPTTMVSSAKADMSHRRLTRLSNGWYIALSEVNPSTHRGINVSVSKDNGATWQLLCTMDAGASPNNLWGASIVSNGSKVVVVGTFQPSTTYTVYTWVFDPTTISGTPNLWNNSSYQATIDSSSQSSGLDNWTSCTVDSTGKFYVGYALRESGDTYKNLKVTSSTDGLNWATSTKVTANITSGNNVNSACIGVKSNNYPYVIYCNGSLLCQRWLGSAWDTSGNYQSGINVSGGFYTAWKNPSTVIDSNDVIYAAAVGNTVSGNPLNIHVFKSPDGGATWTEITSAGTGIGTSNYADCPQLVIAPDGSLVCVYLDKTKVAGSSYNDLFYTTWNGSSWSTPINLTSLAVSNSGETYLSAMWQRNFNYNNTAISYTWQNDVNTTVMYDSINYNSAPNAPTLTTKANFDATTATTLSWTFSDPNNGDAQSAYQLQIVDTSNGSTVIDTGKVTSTSNSYNLAANTLTNGKQYQWRVCTWDNNQVQGPYSSYSTFSTAAAPTTTITTPATDGTTVASSSLTVGWSYSDPASNAQTYFQIQLTDSTGNTVLWDSTKTAGSGNQLTIGDSLANTTSYNVKVTTWNSQGVASATAVRSFSTSFTPPATPTLTVSPNNANGYMALSITNPTPSGSQPTVSYNDVYRRISGSTTWCRIATNIANNGSYNDYAVASSLSYEYKVTAVGSNATSADSLVDTNNIMTLSGIWIHDPTNPTGTIINIPLNDNRSETWTPDSTTMKFAGRSKPIVQFGEQEQYDFNVNLSITLQQALWPTLSNLIRSKKTLCFRDYRGRKVFGVVQSLPESDSRYGQDVSLKVTEIDYQEAV